MNSMNPTGVKTLILMVGLPQSGKTTEALHLGYPIVAPDAIRKTLGCYPFDPDMEQDVWEMAKDMINALYYAGHDTVILDATNLKVQYRKGWERTDRVLRYCVIDTPMDVCIERAKANGKDYLVKVIEKLARDWEEVSEEAEPGFTDRLLM